MKYKLGITATDTITGFSGIITGYAKYLTGCDQYLLQPKCEKADKYPEGQWVDENRLDINNNTPIEIDTKKPPGACGVAPKY